MAKNGNNDSMKIGISIGIFNFIGFFLLLTALENGPLSVVSPIVTLNFIVSVLLSIIVYKEKVTWRKVTGALLTVVAIILLGL